MPANRLSLAELRLRVDPARLGFADTAELTQEALPWIGQERALTAARFGLGLEHPDYHLFVLGDIGTGRSTLLQQEMQAVASQRPAPPDLCYLHNFDAPERPRALRLPACAGPGGVRGRRSCAGSTGRVEPAVAAPGPAFPGAAA